MPANCPGKTGDAISDAAVAAAEQEGRDGPAQRKTAHHVGREDQRRGNNRGSSTEFRECNAGLQTGDEILRIDGKPIKRREDIAAALVGKAGGDKVRVTFVRDDKDQSSPSRL